MSAFTTPPRGNGHRLPTDPGPRVGCVQPDSALGSVAVGAGVGYPISLDKLIAAMTLLASRAYALRKTQWDPRTGPQQCDPFGPDFVDMQLAEVATDLRSALTGLDALRRLTSFPADALAPGAGGRPAGTREVPAGASSDPRPRCAQRESQDNGVRPGVGLSQGVAPMAASFSLPVTKRFLMPGAVEIAAGINEALARRSR